MAEAITQRCLLRTRDELGLSAHVVARPIQAVYDLRLEISEAATKVADQRGDLLDDDA
jgi:hypothetical protein